MGNSSRQRRDARRRAVGRSAPPPVGADPAGATRAELTALIDHAVRLAPIVRALAPRVEQLNAIGAAAARRELDPAVVITDEVLARLAAAWERGWQPADLVHTARRQGSAAVASWTALAVLDEATRSRALDRAPGAWADQLRSLADRHGSGASLDLLLPSGGRATLEQWRTALAALHLYRILPPSTLLMPPPSRWDTTRAAAPRSAAPVTHSAEQRAKMLTKVRSLLAKAESTDFVAEAEAFTAKAQDLMTRYSIDEALLADDAGERVDVDGVRVLIDQPYALEKAGLLHVVAEANRVRAVWNQFASCVTLVGQPTDIGQVDLLFTSTLVQATKAMTQAELSSAAFRRAFLQAFAVRIGERLSASSEEVVASYGSEIVPVLARRTEAVDVEVDRLFPNLTSQSRRRQFDAHGWAAGTRAADEAVLPAGAVES